MIVRIFRTKEGATEELGYLEWDGSVLRVEPTNREALRVLQSVLRQEIVVEVDSKPVRYTVERDTARFLMALHWHYTLPDLWASEPEMRGNERQD